MSPIAHLTKTCPLCNGTGCFVIAELEGTKVWPKAQPCELCFGHGNVYTSEAHMARILANIRGRRAG